MVEDVSDFDREFEFGPLAQSDVLAQRHGEYLGTRSNDTANRSVAETADADSRSVLQVEIRKSIRIEPLVDVAMGRVERDIG